MLCDNCKEQYNPSPEELAIFQQSGGPTDKRDFYQGAANEILWPLFHGLGSRCNHSHQ